MIFFPLPSPQTKRRDTYKTEIEKEKKKTSIFQSRSAAKIMGLFERVLGESDICSLGV